MVGLDISPRRSPPPGTRPPNAVWKWSSSRRLHPWSTRTRFGTVLDVGMFHLSSKDAKKYDAKLQKLVNGGRLYLMCLAESPHESASWPHYYQAQELGALFAGAGNRQHPGGRRREHLQPLGFQCAADVGTAETMNPCRG